jgi:hypothetical protein
LVFETSRALRTLLGAQTVDIARGDDEPLHLGQLAISDRLRSTASFDDSAWSGAAGRRRRRTCRAPGQVVGDVMRRIRSETAGGLEPIGRAVSQGRAARRLSWQSSRFQLRFRWSSMASAVRTTGTDACSRFGLRDYCSFG